ncbi:dephospho-CoA kinase [Octadecabacter ascidiaceicola]|uniref:Dephospho-CoA kinase n=1 Tax=Octadecabacter ascidiaceicola TaxID=1655543 RepID=A0A238KF10_9RHOB|nr:dephospho-CoA kinase [Octadecabacter ascidiaceicola]SMX41197.1 Dephospho-CoA kinase [Octadecabacter ascidiaceicola]
MTFVLGLTGSIGMGKSTTAQMFADEGVSVWDADAVVRELYDVGGKAADIVAQHYPDAMENGAVSREKLRGLIADDPAVLDHLQKIVHPLVGANRAEFLATAEAPVVLLDIPLLFETGTDNLCDGIAVVSVSAEEQRARVLERGEMSEADFELILSRQMPDAEKRVRARWVILTQTLDAARQSVKDILAEIAKELPDA